MYSIGHQGIGAILFGLAFLVVMTTATPAGAVTYSFTNISNNSGVAPQVANQFSVDVTAASGAVNFQFRNTGLTASSITDIYFDNDTSLFNLNSILTKIVNGAGVDFSFGANPNNLPGGTPVGFSSNFGADSNNPPPINGINPGETLAIVLALDGSNTFSSVISALTAGTLRLGLHVQAIANGTSDAFVSQTPLPGALPLFVSALTGLGVFRWAKRRRHPATA